MNAPFNNAAPGFPAFFKDENAAVDCLARYMDFSNEAVENQETGNRVRFVNNMLHQYAGGKPDMNSPEYIEAYDFINKATQALGRSELNLSLPSHPDAKIHSVFNPALGRNVLQLNMGEMTASDWAVPQGMAASQYFHSNRFYARMDDEQRYNVVQEQRQEQSRHTQNTKGFNRRAHCVSNLFGENKETMSLFKKLAKFLGFGKAFKPVS